MKLDFDFHFLSSAYGDSNDEHNNMQFEESHPEPQEISQEIPDPVVPVPPRPTHCTYYSYHTYISILCLPILLTVLSKEIN